MVTRRTLLGAGGLWLAGLAAAPPPRAAVPAGRVVPGRVVEIRMTGDPLGAEVWFDPVGVLVEPGATVRWVVERHVHTATAYPRRIPAGAVTWDSGYLVNAGDRFEVTLTVPGVYDYRCRPHEAAGMVGRLVVGRPPAGGTRAYDDAALPPAARAAFPSVEEIVSKGIVRRR